MFEQYTDPQTFAKIVDWPSVTAMWRNSVSVYAQNLAVEDGETAFTYAQLDARVAAMRGALKAQGIQKGDTVGLFATNGCGFAVAYLAIVTSGACAALLPPQLDGMTVAGLSRMFGLKALVVDAALRAKLPDPMPVVCIGTDCEDEPAEAVEVQPEDPCVIMFTGGTTGRSKGALLSNRAVMTGTKYGCYGIKNVFEQRYFLVLPLTHVFGLIRNLMSCLYTGSALHICRNNKDMFREIAMFRPTVWVVVPALAEMALNLSRQFKRNMLGDSMKTIICGAAPVAPYLVREYHKLGIDLFPGYGLTESANLVSGNPESVAEPESVGIPFPHQEFRIAENGELLLRGKNMMDGYVGVDEPDAYDGDFFRTGDLVRMDDEGYLYITGRIKEIIVLPSGENVSPAEVEAYFNEFDFIQDSQVFEDENELGARILALEVVPRATELAGMEPEEKKKYIVSELEKKNATLPSHFRVSRITVRDADFERTPAMKIVRYRKFQ